MGKGRAGRFVSFAILIFMVVLAVSVFVKARRPETAPADVRPEVGFAAPPLVYTDDRQGKQPLLDLEGRPVRLEDYRGKVVFINFWATWCPPCKREMPDIELIRKRYGDKVAVLAVNATDQDNEGAVRRFVKEYGLTFRVPLDRTGEATEAYQVVFFPTSFFIDGRGIIRAKFEGAISEGMMESAVKKAAQ